MPLIEPKPEFQSLSEKQVMQALADTDPANPVAVEVEPLHLAFTRYPLVTEDLGNESNLLKNLPR